MARKMRKARDPYERLFRPGIPLSDNIELRPDLTPPDLLAGGYVVRPHRYAGFWCWWRKLDGGELFGEPHLDVLAAIASARHKMGLNFGPPHEKEGLVSYFESINSEEAERFSRECDTI